MKKKNVFCAVLMFAVAFGVLFTGCSSNEPDDSPKKNPGTLTGVKSPWYIQREDPKQNITVDVSIDEDDENLFIAKITIEGEPNPDNWWNSLVNYNYSKASPLKTGKRYELIFEAWTEEGQEDREIYANYIESGVGTKNELYCGFPSITLTEERKKFELITVTIPDHASNLNNQALKFHCANQTGTFYIKMISIEETNKKTPIASYLNKWSNDPDLTVKYTVDDETEIITITTSDVNESSEDWHLNVSYNYFAQIGERYEYKFNAWTDSPPYTIGNVQYLNCENSKNNWEGLSFGSIELDTDSTKEYKFTGQPLYAGKISTHKDLIFNVGKQNGTFKLKIISIEKLDPLPPDSQTLSKIANELASSSAGTTVDNPVQISALLDLDKSWNKLLSEIAKAKKYVALDLSDSYGMSFFDPGKANTGEKYIVSLVLPNASNGIMYSDYEDIVVFRYFTSLKNISGKGITYMGHVLFKGSTSLESFDFPKVKNLGWIAFQNCTNLKSVTIPKTVTQFDGGTFKGCTGLESVTFEEESQLTFLCWSAFENCTSLKEITIPANVIKFEGGVFKNCENLESVTFANGSKLEYLSSEAFFGCKKLNNIVLPESLTEMRNAVFKDCTSLSNITTPTNLAYIDENVFENTPWVDSFIGNQSPGFVYIGKVLFAYKGTIPGGVINSTDIASDTVAIGGASLVNKGLTSVTIPDSVKTICSFAFGWNGDLTSVEIPNSVTYIGNGAFVSCENLENINITNNVTFIGAYTFENCTSIDSITIPASVKELQDSVFKGWTNTQTINVPFKNQAEADAAWKVDWTNNNWRTGCSAKIVYTGK